MGHTALVTAFLLPMLFCNGFLVELSNFKANIEQNEQKGEGKGRRAHHTRDGVNCRIQLCSMSNLDVCRLARVSHPTSYLSVSGYYMG